MLRTRGVLLLLLIVLAIAAPAVLGDLFTTVVTALREGVGHALTTTGQ